MATSVETELRAHRRPPRLGDFSEVTGEKRYRLLECPLCALDPDRERYGFPPKSNRWPHFLHDHDADDIGRPMAELLPDRPVATDGGERRA